MRCFSNNTPIILRPCSSKKKLDCNETLVECSRPHTSLFRLSQVARTFENSLEAPKFIAVFSYRFTRQLLGEYAVPNKNNWSASNVDRLMCKCVLSFLHLVLSINGVGCLGIYFRLFFLIFLWRVYEIDQWKTSGRRWISHTHEFNYTSSFFLLRKQSKWQHNKSKLFIIK